MPFSNPKFDKCPHCGAAAARNVIPLVFGDFSEAWPEEFDQGKARYGGLVNKSVPSVHWYCTNCKNNLDCKTEEKIESYLTTRKEMLIRFQDNEECAKNLFKIDDWKFFEATNILLDLNEKIDGTMRAVSSGYLMFYGSGPSFSVNIQRIVTALACGELSFEDIVEFDKTVRRLDGDYLAVVSGGLKDLILAQRRVSNPNYDEEDDPIEIEIDPLHIFTGPFSVPATEKRNGNH